jgi:hypothetical protein
MKNLHYVLIAKHLPSDSEVSFFPTREQADAFFNSHVEPLLKVCIDNELEEDEVYSYGQTKNIIRFDSGYDEDLDSLLGECNHYYYVNSVEVADDVNYFVAELSEWVDESTIEFCNKQNAIIKYNDIVDDNLMMLNDSRRDEAFVLRYDNNTWEDENGTMFSEIDNADDGSTDAFFGYTDVYFIIRIGEIRMGGNNE